MGMMSECKHPNLMRHEIGDEVWWQCEDGCEFIYRGFVQTPPAGEKRLCLICAYYKPWGTFDSKTGASVCLDCRDNTRYAYTNYCETVQKIGEWQRVCNCLCEACDKLREFYKNVPRSAK